MLNFLWQKCGKLKQQSPRGENATRWQLRITVLMWRGHWLMFWTSKIDLASLATHLPMQQHEASHWALAFILGTAEPHYYSDGRQVKLKAFSYFSPKRHQMLLHCKKHCTAANTNTAGSKSVYDNWPTWQSPERRRHSHFTCYCVYIYSTSTKNITVWLHMWRFAQASQYRRWAEIKNNYHTSKVHQHHKPTLQACEISMERWTK